NATVQTLEARRSGMDNDARTLSFFTHEETMRTIARVLITLPLGAALACGGGSETADTAAGSGPDTGGTASTPQQSGGTAADPSQITAEMVALGNEIFHGRQANGICYTC